MNGFLQPPPRHMTSSPTPSIHPTHDSDGKLLPAILCLHGGGSNSSVFRIQTRRLVWNLDKHFRFIYARAPLEGTPGWGMLPVFASVQPFYHWVSHRFKMGESDKEETPNADIRVVDSIITQVMEENGGIESFVGVMGFSQGARLTSGLLLRQQIEQRDLGYSKWNFKFGVMIGGPFPPMGMSEKIDTKDYELLRSVPSVHGWGRDDQVIHGAKELQQIFESDVCFQMDFEGGHHLPLRDDEARDLCDLILAAYYAGGGAMVVGADETY